MILIFPGGRVSSAQLKTVAKIVSAREEDGFADITACANLRLPGFSDERMPEVRRQMEEAGLAASDTESPPEPSEDILGVRQQDEELFSLGIPVLAGRLTASQIRKFADITERNGSGSLRLTPLQNVFLPDIPKEKVAHVLEGLDGVGLRVNASVFHLGLVVCGAGDKALGGDLADYLEKQVPLAQPLKIHLSDSSCGCAHSSSAEIGLEGQGTLTVRVGGFTAPGVPARQVKFRLEKLLMAYKRGRSADESFTQFCQRAGDAELARLLSDEEPEAAPG